MTVAPKVETPPARLLPHPKIQFGGGNAVCRRTLFLLLERILKDTIRSTLNEEVGMR